MEAMSAAVLLLVVDIHAWNARPQLEVVAMPSFDYCEKHMEEFVRIHSTPIYATIRSGIKSQNKNTLEIREGTVERTMYSGSRVLYSECRELSGAVE